MNKISGFVAGISKTLDMIAGLFLVITMLLIVTNIILREFAGCSILGTYEYVGYLTASAVGLAVANCAVQNGHIAVGFIIDRLSSRKQALVEAFINIVAVVFWGFSALYICKYAKSMVTTGVVSPTTQTPFYPFVYMVALGVFVLCLVLLVKLLDSFKKVVVNK